MANTVRRQLDFPLPGNLIVADQILTYSLNTLLSGSERMRGRISNSSSVQIRTSISHRRKM
jgi:hypothetical protein